jgi:hypothetical protein
MTQREEGDRGRPLEDVSRRRTAALALSWTLAPLSPIRPQLANGVRIRYSPPMKGAEKPKKAAKKQPQKSLKEKRAEKRADKK